MPQLPPESFKPPPRNSRRNHQLHLWQAQRRDCFYGNRIRTQKRCHRECAKR
ncbi:Uncharacterised protein [Mycobacteroides abscessus subsp. abscessus]|nr:Uncharacterised protein [Mycobacteroides abscessus subsp. abscessus]